MSNQRVLLVFPPNFSVDQPYLALPALVAFLRANGITDVHHWDCNIEAFRYYIEASTLTGLLERVKSARVTMEKDGELPDAKLQHYHALCHAELASGPVITDLVEAKSYFNRMPVETSVEEYTYYMSVLSKAFEIVSAAYYPTEISMRDFAMRFSCQNSADILQGISSPENPYLDYFRTETVPRLEKTQPSLVGVSVACMAQIIPAFTLAKLVHETLPGARVVFGGQVFNRLIDAVTQIPQLFDLVDYFVVREGETALLQLLAHLDGEIPVTTVPNLIYFDRDANRVVESELASVEDISALPPPDFSDLDLSLYLSPEPVLPYQPVRGCYWHNCAFCNHYAIHAKGVRAKAEKQAIDELRHLRDTYGTRYITLVNESIEPRLLHRYTTAMIESNLGLEWYVGARLEPAFDRSALQDLQQAGCKKLYFGLETGSANVLRAMRKGITLPNAERILRDCGELGIGVHLFLMLGFPTETARDLKQSNDEIRRLASLLDPATLSYYISIYQLKPCTPTYETPSAFGITSISQVDSGRDLEYLYSFESIDRGELVDYEEERVRLETSLDAIQGTPRYPENVVHFITMQTAFDALRSSRLTQANGELVTALDPSTQLQVRRGLGFGTFLAAEGTPSVGSEPSDSGPLTITCALDIMFDEVLVLQPDTGCETLNELKSGFTMKELQDAIRAQGTRMGRERAAEIATGLVGIGVVVPMNTQGSR